MAYIASDVIEAAVGHLNDINQRIYTDAKLLPYCMQAQRDLQDELIEIDSSYIKEDYSSAIDVSANSTTFTHPTDFISPIELYERPDGGTDKDWTLVEQVEFVDFTLTTESSIIQWCYREGIIQHNKSSVAREVRLLYEKGIPIITSTASAMPPDFAFSYYGFRVAALGALLIGENPSRAEIMQMQANVALQKILGREVKENQPFVATRMAYAGRRRR